MKKIIILLSVIALASCSLLPDNGGKDIESINKAEQTAMANINQCTDKEIARAKREIGNQVASVVSKADSTLTRQSNAVAQSLNKAKAISFIGIAIGILGIILAILAYRKRPRTNVTEVKDLIAEEVNTIRNEIRGIAGGQSSSYRPQSIAPSQAVIERAIEAYITSKKFKDILQQYIATTVSTQSIAENIKMGSATTPTAKLVHQIYAKESNSMILSSIQDTYQRGKSIYKLTMSEPGASTAEITVCIEREEVKQRILKFDSQYFEPICSLIRSSNAPSEVVIKTTGTAERIGEEWKVIRPIIVEIK